MEGALIYMWQLEGSFGNSFIAQNPPMLTLVLMHGWYDPPPLSQCLGDPPRSKSRLNSGETQY